MPEDDADRLGNAPCLANLRRLSVYAFYPGLLPGSYATSLRRLDAWWYHDGFFEQLAATSLPRLRWLGLREAVSVSALAPLLRGHRCPNLCTLVFNGRAFNQPEGELVDLVTALAKAEGMPHLSLVGVGWSDDQNWWVLGKGRAVPVAPGVLPLDKDWWETDLADWWV